ncbi:MAG: hypothetical protein NTZ05_14770 [Chloroflexi bacterium]|nr:hypothetical protein [Chloroflexota bacterium]
MLDALLNAEGRNVTLVDGAFIAPESGQDRAALAMRGWPNGHLRVIWMPAGPREIFSDLPGAALLETLATQDGHADPYSHYDLALKYYEASCGALAMLMELTTVPGVKHSGFDRQGAATAFAPVTAGAAARAPLHALPSVRTLAPLSPEADAHRRVRSELEGLLHLPMRLRGLGDLLARQGERIAFSEGGEPAPGTVSIDAARDALRAVTDAYRAEMLQGLTALGSSIAANDVPRLTRRAESLRMAAQEQALARLRALAATARRTSVEASAG